MGQCDVLVTVAALSNVSKILGTFQGVQSAEFLTRTIVGVIVVCFVLDALLLSQPTAMTLAVGMWPTIRGETLYTAMALVGANAMPHTFYCHSPLAKVCYCHENQA